MLSRASRHPWALKLLAVACVCMVVGSVVALLVTTDEALEEREAATAATDLRLAVLTVASVQSTANAAPAELARLDNAIMTLEADHTLALHALEPSVAAEVTQAIEVIADHGAMLAMGMESISEHGLMDHEGAEVLLRQASVESNASASTNESRAKWAMLAGVLGLLLGSYCLVALRWAANHAAARREGELQAAKRLAAVLNETPDAKLIIAEDGAITYHSAGVLEILGSDTVPTNIRSLTQLADPAIRDQLLDHLLTADANTPPLTFNLAQLISDYSRDTTLEIWVSDLRSDPLVDGRLITARDVTVEARLQEELERRALLDALTGLPNRWSLMNLMEKGMSGTSLLMIDLDGFKQTNDVLGHGAGDQLLTVVATRFASAVPSESNLFRLGGDEFAVIIPTADGHAASDIAADLLATLATSVRLDQGFESLRASIGIAIASDEAEPTELLKHADTALYAAKAAGGNQFKIFEQPMAQAATRRRDLTLALDSADIESEFRTVYQPIVDAASGQITHLEALLRWTSPSLGAVPPDIFISVAEASGKIIPMGQFVLESACQQLVDLRNAGLAAEVGMTVNISPRQLDQLGFVDQVLDTVRVSGLTPSDLTIEVTESVLFLEVSRGMNQLHALKAAGCHIAVDDFGSGYSNLGRLLELPLDLIKVDRSLLVTLDEMRESHNGSPEMPCQVMSSIVAIGQAIGAPIVAEGVETNEQWQSLRSSGVGLLQGYLFSRPVEKDEVAALLVAGVVPDRSGVLAG